VKLKDKLQKALEKMKEEGIISDESEVVILEEGENRD